MRSAPLRTLFLSIVIGLVAGLGFAIYALRVQEIRVTGVRTLDPKRVIEVSGLRTGERLLWIRLSVVARRLEEIPSIQSVTVDRSLPQTVVIYVRERNALALLDRRPDLAVDAEGMQFPRPTEGRLPVLEGWRGRAKAGGAIDRNARTVLGAFQSFPYTIRALATRITVGPPLVVHLGATEIRFGTLDDLARKATIADEVLVAERGNPLEYIDVRAPSVPVSRRRAPPTAVPTPVPSSRPRPAATPAASSPPSAKPSAAPTTAPTSSPPSGR